MCSLGVGVGPHRASVFSENQSGPGPLPVRSPECSNPWDAWRKTSPGVKTHTAGSRGKEMVPRLQTGPEGQTLGLSES